MTIDGNGVGEVAEGNGYNYFTHLSAQKVPQSTTWSLSLLRAGLLNSLCSLRPLWLQKRIAGILPHGCHCRSEAVFLKLPNKAKTSALLDETIKHKSGLIYGRRV